MPPRVSVVLPARDEAADIVEAIRSIREQTFGDWELLVVDDGSTDATARLAEAQAAADPRIRVLRREPRGQTAAINAGLRAARAELIARQDADDRSLPERLARQVAFLDAHPEVGLVGTDWLEEGPDGRPRPRRGQFVAGCVDERLVDRNPLSHTSVVFRRSAVPGGGYDERYAEAEDYDLWLRMRRAGVVLWNLDEPLVVRRMASARTSPRRERVTRRAELRMRSRDLAARARARDDVARAVLPLARTAASLALPLAVKRRMRERRGQKA